MIQSTGLLERRFELPEAWVRRTQKHALENDWRGSPIRTAESLAQRTGQANS
jgi:hypothetical protein